MRIISNRRKSSLMNVFVAGAAAIIALALPIGAAAQTITEFTVPTAVSQPWLIAAGPDGALWFTEYNGNKIGRITTTGTITEFTIPTVNSGPSTHFS
jgi:streptogramin lyase